MKLVKKAVIISLIGCLFALLNACSSTGTRHVTYSSHYSYGWNDSMYYDSWYRRERNIVIVPPPRRGRPELKPRPPRSPPSARPRSPRR